MASLRSHPSLSSVQWRLLGGAIVLLCVLLFQPGAQTDLQRLWLPLLFGLGAALTLQNLLAVLATGALLALIRMEPATGDWINAAAYPLIGSACGLATLAILVARFRTNIRTTRSARAARRSTTQDDD